ncbi:hypothetical protein [Flavobacterium caeni]|uniref:Uncharacterized protein n=1 Tax=Flavobacterium caeni TaxID=490189 RepID=A0A1G5FCD3_9FLAO|nr:hypothetical protein [Flavobacterium caeni]SCY36932.1 hypothetical protein SAMN02927903_01251 [Flavobacterium caeni]
MERIILYNKDLQLLTGKSEKACYRLMHKIRDKMGKPADIPITIHEFCEYMRIRPELVRVYIK